MNKEKNGKKSQDKSESKKQLRLKYKKLLIHKDTEIQGIEKKKKKNSERKPKSKKQRKKKRIHTNKKAKERK